MGLGHTHEPVTKVFYLEAGATGSGHSEDDAAPIDDVDLLADLQGLIVEEVDVEVVEAVTGATTVDVGDDDDPDGFVPTASLTLATPGLYATGPDLRGAYLQDTGAARKKKYNAGTTKSLKVATDAAGTAGKLRVYFKGFRARS